MNYWFSLGFINVRYGLSEYRVPANRVCQSTEYQLKLFVSCLNTEYIYIYFFFYQKNSFLLVWPIEEISLTKSLQSTPFLNKGGVPWASQRPEILKSNIWLFSFFFGRSGGASRVRVCYQRGLPHIVSMDICGKKETWSSRAWLHRETMDFFRVKTMLMKTFWSFFLPIFIISSNIEETTIRFSYFYLFKVQRWLNRFVYITTNHSCCSFNCSSVQANSPICRSPNCLSSCSTSSSPSAATTSMSCNEQPWAGQACQLPGLALNLYHQVVGHHPSSLSLRLSSTSWRQRNVHCSF